MSMSTSYDVNTPGCTDKSTQNIAINNTLLSHYDGSQSKKSDKLATATPTIQLYSYTIDTLRYTEEQLQWLETHVQVFEAAVLEGQHFNWLETFLVEWFKRWPENPNGIYYEDEEEEDHLARKNGILWHLTMRLGHSWSLDAETGTEESRQIKFGILEYLHQFNDKALVTKVVD